MIAAGVEVLWSEFANDRSQAVRDQLLLAYRPLVRYVATRQAQSLPPSVEVQDLVSYGLFGLLDAIEKFDPAREVKFETFAIQRIRGAILDELRALDWAPRSVRSRARAIEKAMSKLEHELGRTPAAEELATAVGITTSDLSRSISHVRLAAQDSLDRVVHQHQTGTNSHADETVADHIEALNEDVGLSSELAEVSELLAEGITRLPRRERTFMALYYFEGMSLTEIGQALGVSESRVCQLHTRAAVALQRTLAGQAV